MKKLIKKKIRKMQRVELYNNECTSNTCSNTLALCGGSSNGAISCGILKLFSCK